MKLLSNTGKKLLKTLCVLGCTLGVANMLCAQNVFITVDENGNGTMQAPAGTTNLSWSLGPDPTGGVPNWNVLMYQLPFPTVAGDVLFGGDPNHDPGVLYGGDVVRFTETGLLIFYSDTNTNDVAPLDLADTPGPPAPLLNNQAIVTEQGVEDVYDFANYAPLPNQPGWDPSNPTYLFISDVPEPSTLSLIGAGFVGLLLKAYRRGRK